MIGTVKQLRTILMWVIIGGIGIAILIGIALPNLFASRRSANGAMAAQLLRMIHSAESTFADQQGNGHFGTAEELAQGKYLDAEKASALKSGKEINGYIVKLKVMDKGFQATATPAVLEGFFRTGDRGFFIDDSGVMRGSRAPHEAHIDDSPL